MIPCYLYEKPNDMPSIDKAYTNKVAILVIRKYMQMGIPILYIQYSRESVRYLLVDGKKEELIYHHVV